jgi:hypothetical protein
VQSAALAAGFAVKFAEGKGVRGLNCHLAYFSDSDMC